MNKLKAAVMYQCSTKLKAMGIFYLIQYSITALIFAIVIISTGGAEMGSNALEFSSVVFVSVIGVLGYYEDFKALLQNGYTRRYIFLATIGMFAFVASAMALLDCVIGNALHYFNGSYFTLFGALYGYGHLFFNWLWLAALYFMFCSSFYLGVLVIKKAGKIAALSIGVGLCGLVLLGIALFRFVLSPQLVSEIFTFMAGAMGFMQDGAVWLILPVLSFLLIGTALELGSYALIRRTELK